MSSSVESFLKSCVLKSFDCFLSFLTSLHHHIIFFFLFNFNFQRFNRTKSFPFPRETQEGLGLLTNLGFLEIHYRMSHLLVSDVRVCLEQLPKERGPQDTRLLRFSLFIEEVRCDISWNPDVNSVEEIVPSFCEGFSFICLRVVLYSINRLYFFSEDEGQSTDDFHLQLTSKVDTMTMM